MDVQAHPPPRRPNQEGRDPDIASGVVAFSPAVAAGKRGLAAAAVRYQGWWFLPAAATGGAEPAPGECPCGPRPAAAGTAPPVGRPDLPGRAAQWLPGGAVHGPPAAEGGGIPRRAARGVRAGPGWGVRPESHRHGDRRRDHPGRLRPPADPHVTQCVRRGGDRLPHGRVEPADRAPPVPVDAPARICASPSPTSAPSAPATRSRTPKPPSPAPTGPSSPTSTKSVSPPPTPSPARCSPSTTGERGHAEPRNPLSSWQDLSNIRARPTQGAPHARPR